MNGNNPLESVFFVKLPEDFSFSCKNLKIDKNIPLPVQKKDGDDSDKLDVKNITQEQILSGILTVLAYDRQNENLDYYRSFITEVRPGIKKELGEAGILKTKNEDWDLAEEIWMALHGLDPEDRAITLNMALFFDQKADSYRKAGLIEDADAYDSTAGVYYHDAMDSA